ncbi:MAG: peroxidase family protein [Pseudomonadota bacterium]
MRTYLVIAWVPVVLSFHTFITGSVEANSNTFRSLDGTDNNISNPDWGAANTIQLRLTSPVYEDGYGIPRSSGNLPSARAVSNAVSAQSELTLNRQSASGWLWQWGQFIDHDLVLTHTSTPAESYNIEVPTGDKHFDPYATGQQTISLTRSEYQLDEYGVRQQKNQITAYIDGSQVYGSDSTRAENLRDTASGMGLLRTSLSYDSSEVLLPLNTAGLENAGGPGANLFIAGDIRANEQLGLAATHTVFVREHNRIATELSLRLDSGDAALIDRFNLALASGVSDRDEFLYQAARTVVGAEIQKITYEEYIPALLGANALGGYSGYDETIDSGISNEFSTAAFRLGHTQLSPTLRRLNGDGSEAGAGDIALMNAFFNPEQAKIHGVDSLLAGLAYSQSEEIDTLIIDDLRNFLFGPPGAGGFDLASLNIQRGRDHGIQSLNGFRSSIGLDPYQDFFDLTGNQDLAAQFASVYQAVDDVDLWIGGLAEQQFGSSQVGETFNFILVDQFTRTRDGDRYFYEQASVLEDILLFDPNFLSNSLSSLITQNTNLSGLSDDVFYYSHPVASVPVPSSIWLFAAGAFFTFGYRRQRIVKTSLQKNRDRFILLATK